MSAYVGLASCWVTIPKILQIFEFKNCDSGRSEPIMKELAGT